MFEDIHLHLPSIDGLIDMGQGSLSLLSKLVRGIIGILKRTVSV
jgi:hypothetical protein